MRLSELTVVFFGLGLRASDVTPVNVNLRRGVGQHDLHVHECDGGRARVQHVGVEYLVEVRRGENLRTVRAASEEVFNDATEESSAICI